MLVEYYDKTKKNKNDLLKKDDIYPRFKKAKKKVFQKAKPEKMNGFSIHMMTNEEMNEKYEKYKILTLQISESDNI